MEHTDKDQGEQDWTTNKKRRRGVEEDMDQDVEVSATCRKFGIILGAFRTEVEVLAELHLMYPWINLTRRTNGAGSAILITKDDRTRKLLTDLKEINAKDCAFRPLMNQAKKAYIMMGSTGLRDRGITPPRQGSHRSRQDDQVEYREEEGGTNQLGEDCTGWKTTPRPFHQRIRELPTEALCKQTPAVLQLSEVWTPGQDLQVRGPDLQVLRGKTRVGPVQGQRESYTEVRKLRTGACHHQSPLPKDAGSREQSEIVTQGKCNQSSQQDPSPHPIDERMDRIGRTRGGKGTINTTSHNHPGPNGGKYKGTTVCKEVQTTSDQETRTGKGSSRPSTSYQGLDKTTSAVDDGVSCSDVSKPVPSQDHWPSKTHQPASHKRCAKRTRNKSKMYWRPYR